MSLNIRTLFFVTLITALRLESGSQSFEATLSDSQTDSEDTGSEYEDKTLKKGKHPRANNSGTTRKKIKRVKYNKNLEMLNADPVYWLEEKIKEYEKTTTDRYKKSSKCVAYINGLFDMVKQCDDQFDLNLFASRNDYFKDGNQDNLYVRAAKKYSKILVFSLLDNAKDEKLIDELILIAKNNRRRALSNVLKIKKFTLSQTQISDK